MNLRPAEIVPVGGAAAIAVAGVLGGAFYPGQRLVIGVLLALLLGWFGWQRRRFSLRSEERIFFVLVAWGGVSATLVGMSPLAAKEVLTGWLVAWCLWIAARRATPESAVFGASILIATALLVVGGVVLEAIGQGSVRTGGLFESPNIAASLLVVTLPLVGKLRNSVGRPWLILVGGTLVGGVVLTGSRAGLLALLVAGSVLLPRGRIRVVGVLTGAVAITGVLAWRFVSQPEILAWFRPAIWLGVLRLWATSPVLGVGPGGLTDAAGPVRLLHSDHVGQHQFLITYAESSPLGLLVQTGIVGLCIAVVGAALWIRQAYRSGTWDSPGLRSAVMGMVVMAAFHDFVTIEVVLWWWALVLGFLEAGGERIDAAEHQRPEHRVTRTVRALALAIIVLWGIVQPGWARWLWRVEPKSADLVDRAQAAEPWYAQPLDWRVRVLLDEEHWSWETAAEALALGRQAVRIHPGASRLWMTLGHVHYRIINELGAWPDSVAGARAAFERAAELEPRQPWSWLEWARLERGLGNLDESAVLVQRAISTEPHAVPALLFLARIELDRGNIPVAREALDRAKASVEIRHRAGLKPYEKELLWGPGWQFREIETALR